MRTFARVASLLPLLCSVSCLPVLAQGTSKDYQRALNVGRRASGKVFPTAVKPHWLPGNDAFWYVSQDAPRKRSYFLVNTLTGEKQPVFDTQRLSEALAKSLGQPATTDQPSVDPIDFSSDLKLFRFKSAGKQWSLDRTTYELTPLENSQSAGKAVDKRIRPSRTSSEETEITFVNHTNTDTDWFWINMSGERVKYATLKPGESRPQHTFVSHVWLATSKDGDTLGVFEAEVGGSDAVIENPSADQSNPSRDSTQPNDSPRRQRRNRSISPDWNIAVKAFNITATNRETRKEVQLSHDGTESDTYNDRVYWAPDGKKFVAFQVRKGADHKVYLVESSPPDQVQPKLHEFQYLKPGDDVPLKRPRLFDVEHEKQIPIPDALFPNPWDISDIRWEPDSSRFTFLYNQRGHQVLRIISVDANSGAASALVNESSNTFIDYSQKQFAHWLDESHELIWMSERDGWNHLWLYDAASGSIKNQITRGNWLVRRVEKVDAQNRQIWFVASGIRPEQDPYYLHLARVNFDGTGLVVLTDGDGTHQWEFSPDNRWILDTWSRVDLPPVTAVRSAADGHLVCSVQEASAADLLATGWRMPERFTAKGRDGATDIYGIIIRPSNFDPALKYPVIEKIYAGPQDAFVPKSWGTQSQPRSIAELGFIVVQIDGMGTNWRSRAFHDVCWKNLKDAGFPDRIAWLRAAAAKHPEMDLDQVGIYGGSAGGQNALGALLFHGDFYKVSVADCGCHDNRMDKIWWNEAWMGWPIGPEYADNSNVTHAAQLQGKLFLTFGELDRNVDPSSSMQVVNALIKANKQFDMLVVPGAGHGIGESPYMARRRMDFFVRHLLHKEPPSD